MKEPLDLTNLNVFPLAERKSLSQLEEILVDPDSRPPSADRHNLALIRKCAKQIALARKKRAAVMLIYGAHLIKNGAARILIRLMKEGCITHLATNGAGIIHDWEFSFLGRSTESVKQNVATGTFGAWAETGRNIHLALLGGGIEGWGLGYSIGRFISEDGTDLPAVQSLEAMLKANIRHDLTPARADLLHAMRLHHIAPGHHEVRHAWKADSVLAQSYKLGVPLTVHPGIGYDIISCHPMFNGAVIGRAATIDFQRFGSMVEKLDNGIVLSVGSAIMGPQVFEKSLSCVNNLRLKNGRKIVRDHNFYVVDLQDGGQWDWSKGEPPRDNPAYYLRFCKSYSRMGGTMNYLQCDNVTFLHQLLRALDK